jgi:hypothetical protein
MQTHDAKTTSRLLGDIDLQGPINNSTSALSNSPRAHIAPTGASTLIDISSLNVGELYAESMVPVCESDRFGEFILLAIAGLGESCIRQIKVG